MSDRLAIAAGRIFDGDAWHQDTALLIADGVIEGIVARRDIPAGVQVTEAGAMLVPGFIDLQVNGGGGLMLNDKPDVDTLEIVCKAQMAFGTTAVLPTLITDTREITRSTIAAGVEAAKRKVPGFLGLHLEGPHLSLARKGAHDPQLIRPMDAEDEAALIAARPSMPVLLTTIAPESVKAEQVKLLSDAGIVISLGHTDTSYRTAKDYAEAGASMATHLFNAMSQIGNREPGLVGAAVNIPTLSAGLIADGIHVNPAAMHIALKAKNGPARIFLVSDAMATIGTDLTSFQLNGRTIKRENGRLTLENGTLAGADLDMISAVRFMHEKMGYSLDEAIRMASLYPAEAVKQEHRLGRLAKGYAANAVQLTDELDVSGTWIDGKKVFEA